MVGGWINFSGSTVYSGCCSAPLSIASSMFLGFFSLLQEFSDLTLQSDNFPVVYLCLFFFFVCLFCACVYLKCSLKHHACLGTLPCGGAVIEERISSINVLFTAESHLQGKETT